jgi:hypothetical protein
MNGAVDFMPATLSRTVQGQGNYPKFHDIPRVTQGRRARPNMGGGEQEDTYNLTPKI